MTREEYMQNTLKLAEEAKKAGEVPVGCVITDSSGNIIGSGHNLRESEKSALKHAEIIAIDEACRTLGSWRLTGCSLYVTLEPCPMCAGAIINSRISSVFYGAPDSQMGACGGVINIFMERFGHKPKLYGGILEQECAEILSGFFKKIREK